MPTDIFPVDFAKQHHYYLTEIFTSFKIGIIFVGTHGHGSAHHMIFGSISEGVLRNTSHPVLMIPTHDRK